MGSSGQPRITLITSLIKVDCQLSLHSFTTTLVLIEGEELLQTLETLLLSVQEHSPLLVAFRVFAVES